MVDILDATLPSGWRRTRIDEIATVKSGSTPLRSKHHLYYEDGSIPWVKTMDLTNGPITVTDEKITLLALKESSCPLLEPGTVLVAMYGGFNQIGRTGLMTFCGTINQAISALVVDRQQTIPEYLLYWLNGNVSTWKRIAASSRKDPNITGRDVAAFPLLLPPLAEQRKIAQILGTWDAAIAKVEQLIAALQLRKKGLMQRLLTGEVRFPEFVRSPEKRATKFGSLPTDWDYVPISQIAQEVSARNTGGDELPVLSCTKYDGLVDSLEYFGRQIFSKDTSSYKVVKRGQFAYATNHIEEGSIGYQDKYDYGLISPMYTVFATKGMVEDAFLYRLLKTELYRHIFEMNTSGTVDRRGRLAWADFARINVPLPGLEEQVKIAGFLAIADQEINLRTQYMDYLRQQTRGLMQQLLTGQVRVPIR